MKRLILLCLMFLSIGCASTAYPVVPVEGKLTYSDGNPLPQGTQLLFKPADGKVGSATGKTDASGNFSVRHVKGLNGAETAKYTVVLSAPDGDKTFYKIVPKTYYEEGFSVEVTKDMKPLDLKVKRK